MKYKNRKITKPKPERVKIPFEEIVKNSKKRTRCIK
jgi:hypothetical protein